MKDDMQRNQPNQVNSKKKKKKKKKKTFLYFYLIICSEKTILSIWLKWPFHLGNPQFPGVHFLPSHFEFDTK